MFLRNMICFVIYGVNLYVSKHKSNSFEKKMYDILIIFVKIFHDFGLFFATWMTKMKRIRKTAK